MATHLDPYEAADAPLREKEACLVTELDAVRKSRAMIAAAREAGGHGGSPPLNVSAEQVAPPAMPIADKYKGIGLEVAATRYLSESDQIELTGKQIWAGLADVGFTLLSDRPEQSVSWALRKREKKVKDVILVGDGKWGMVSWYSQARLKELRLSRNNASTRNRTEHVEKTKAGIANAKRTRLNHWGRKRTISGDQMAGAYHAIQRGEVKSKLQASKAANMAWPTYMFYWCQYQMENWKPEDQFPPPRREIPKKVSEISLDDMWPREKGQSNGHAKDNEPQLTLRPAE